VAFFLQISDLLWWHNCFNLLQNDASCLKNKWIAWMYVPAWQASNFSALRCHIPHSAPISNFSYIITWNKKLRNDRFVCGKKQQLVLKPGCYWNITLKQCISKTTSNLFLGAKSTSIRDCVGWSVRPPRCAITWKTSYVAIASRRGGGRGNWLCRNSITSRFHS
jgi:hypothetical protein